MFRRSGWPGALCGIALLAAWSTTASAHVEYVVDDPQDVADAVGFLLATLSAPRNLAPVVGGGVATVAIVAAYYRFRPLSTDVDAFRAAMDEYRHLVPWLLRIAVGFPLIGAGFSGYLFSPAVPADARILQVGIGFLLLFGLATRATALAGLGTFLFALAVDPRVVLASEFVPGFLAIALVGPGSPSADEVLARIAGTDGTLYGRLDPVGNLANRVRERVAPYRSLYPTVLRVGLGANFAYLGLTQKLFAPGPALAVVAEYDLTAVVPVSPELWVVGAGLAEIGIGLVLVAGAFTRAASLTALVMFTATLFGLPDDPVLAHLSLFGLASALLITGAGPLSVDEALGTTHGRDREEADAVAGRTAD